MSTAPVVIIGAIAAGMSAASQIKRSLPDREVIVYGNEKFISYGACGMPYFISGEIKDYHKLMVLKPEKAINERKINLFTQHQVLAINRCEKKVRVKNLLTNDVFEQSYSKLVMATGSQAIIPPFPNVSLPGIFVLKTLQDSIDLSQYMENKKPVHAVIVGAGFIGLEVAESFRKKGINVTVIEAAPRILGVLDPDFSQLVEEELRRNQVQILVNEKVKWFQGETQIQEVVLESGKTIPADLVLLSIGVTPNTNLAKECGLVLGERNAILVNSYLQTSDPDIYAGGDCATVYHKLLKKDLYVPLALGANRQGRMCGENIVSVLKNESQHPFPGIIASAMTRLFDYEIGKTGIGAVEIERYQLSGIASKTVKYVAKAGYYPERSRIYVTIYFEKATSVVVGAQIVGQNGSVLRLDTFVAAIFAGMTLQEVYELDTGYCPPFSPVWDPILVAARSAMSQDEI